MKVMGGAREAGRPRAPYVNIEYVRYVRTYIRHICFTLGIPVLLYLYIRTTSAHSQDAGVFVFVYIPGYMHTVMLSFNLAGCHTRGGGGGWGGVGGISPPSLNSPPHP